MHQIITTHPALLASLCFVLGLVAGIVLAVIVLYFIVKWMSADNGYAAFDDAAALEDVPSSGE